MARNLRGNNNEYDYRKSIITERGRQGSICAVSSIAVAELMLIIRADA